jgi:hypothetical protein
MMQQKNIDPDPARSCGLCNPPELQATLSGVWDQIRLESMNSKSFCDL